VPNALLFLFSTPTLEIDDKKIPQTIINNSALLLTSSFFRLNHHGGSIPRLASADAAEQTKALHT
jgi:hypothetical protein